MRAAEATGVRGWLDRALFAPLDPTATALFRIGLAGMIVLVFRPIPGWPLPEILEGTTVTRMLWQEVFLTRPYWALAAAMAGAVALGVRPRVAGGALTLVLAPLVLLEGRQNARQVLLLALLAFSFVRSDAALAVGRVRGDAPAGAGPSWPLRLVQLQLSVLYLVNALAKTTPEYLSGRVPALMMETFPNFLVRPVDGAVPVGPFAVPLWLGATAVVLTEYVLAFGFWFPRARVATAALGVLFHGTLLHVVRIGFLDLVSVFLYAAFLLPFERRADPVAAARAGVVGARETPSGS